MTTQAGPLQISDAKPKQPDSTGLLLQRKCACGSSASALTGQCEECGNKRTLGLQPKLVISEPRDRSEQEADRIADDVMRMPAPVVQRQAAPEDEEPETKREEGATADLIQPKVRGVGGEEYRAKRSSAQSTTPAAAFSSRPAELNDGGRALSDGARDFFEPRFRHDFSKVRVHNDRNADSLSREINAKAFTVGTDIYFEAGAFRPDTTDGKRLLAHELTHAIQQETGRAREQGTGRLVQREPRSREERRDRRRHGSLLRFLRRVERRKRPLKQTKRRCDRAGEILKLIESKNEEFAEALENEGIAVTEDTKNKLREFCGPGTGKAVPPETEGQAEDQAVEAPDESKESDEAETSLFADCDPPRDLNWKDFKEVDPGSLGKAKAQVHSLLIPNQDQNRISGRLGPSTRVEKGEKSKSVLEHEQIHWKITCKIVQLANKELAAGANFLDVFRVTEEVHRSLNEGTVGLYDRDTLDPDAIPKFDWQSEWSKVVEEHWEGAVQSIKTITIQPLK